MRAARDPKPVVNADGRAPLSQSERDTWDFRRLKEVMERLQAESVGRYEIDPEEAYITMVRTAAYQAGISIVRAEELLKQFYPDDPLLERLVSQRKCSETKATPKPKIGYAAPKASADPYPRFAPGEYLLRCTEAKIYRDPQFRRYVCRLAFSSPNIHEGETVFGFLNLGNGDKPTAGRRSRYWKAWTKANCGKSPTRRQPMLPNIFEGMWCKVVVSDVMLDSDQQQHPAGAVYSSVSDILEVSRA